MESGKKEETNKSTVIRQNRAMRPESWTDPDFQSDISTMCCVVFECDPISSKQINFATARQNEYISRSATLNIMEHILFYLILKSSVKKFAFKLF